MREENADIMTVIQEGKYTERYLSRLGAATPKFTGEDLSIISSKLDFVGLNVYDPTWIRASNSPAGYEVVPFPASYPHMASTWLNIGPEVLYWTPKLAADVWKLRDIYMRREWRVVPRRYADCGGNGSGYGPRHVPPQLSYSVAASCL